VPLKLANSFKIDNKIHPEPVPISRIFNLDLYLNLSFMSSRITSVSGLGIKTLSFTKKLDFQNSFFFNI